MARKDSQTHKQESLPEKVEAPLNIEATPFGSVLKSGELSSPNFRQRRSGWRVQSDGTAEFRNISASGTFSIGGTTKTISSVLDIQNSLNEISTAGGGTLYLAAGTYLLTADIAIPDGVALFGVSRDGVIIDCNSSYKITMSGSDPYNTGTCSVNDGSTTVTGGSTSWTSAMAGQYMLLDGFWYEISSVTSGTELKLVDTYSGSNLSGAAYMIATPNFNPAIGKLTIQNATGVALEIAYASEPNVRDVYVLDSGTGIDGDYIYAPNIFVSIFGCTTGLNYNYVSAFKIDYSAFELNSGVGVVMTNCSGSTFFDSSVSFNTGDGINLTSCSNIAFISMDVSLNGGQGIEMISGNTDLQFVAVTADGNTSDGYKLTATTDRVSISTCSIVNNGGYGINIAAATCDDNYIIAPSFSNNTSGEVNDLGTNTVIIRPVADRQEFTASGTWTKPLTGTIAHVECWGGGGSGGKGQAGGTNGVGGGGGGGGFIDAWLLLSDITATTAVTIGTGGTSITTAATSGNAGGNTTFGSYLTAYGGGGGGYRTGGDVGAGGGGGGGLLSAGTTVGDSATGGTGGTVDGGTGGNENLAGTTVQKGGAGGGGGDYGGTGGAGGSSVYGGAGGGGGGDPGGAGGTSITGGNGGAGSNNTDATAGSQPGGGGGGTFTGNSGAGGAGKVIVTVI